MKVCKFGSLEVWKFESLKVISLGGGLDAFGHHTNDTGDSDRRQDCRKGARLLENFPVSEDDTPNCETKQQTTRLGNRHRRQRPSPRLPKRRETP